MTQIHYFEFERFPVTFNSQKFRGAFIKAMGDKATSLMHNHDAEGLRYAYPQAQYKLINGFPGVLALGKTGDIIACALNNGDTWLSMAGKTCRLSLRNHTISDYEPIIDDSPKYYTMTSWMPLTDGKDKQHDALMALTDRICFLENVLVGNVLSFLKGVGHHAEEQLFCVISDIHNEYMVNYKNAQFRAFDVSFVSNILLPDYAGLGKSSSIGMGVIKRRNLPETFKHHESL